MKHIQGRNNEAWVGVEPSTLRNDRRNNDAANHSVTLPTMFYGFANIVRIKSDIKVCLVCL